MLYISGVFHCFTGNDWSFCAEAAALQMGDGAAAHQSPYIPVRIDIYKDLEGAHFAQNETCQTFRY